MTPQGVQASVRVTCSLFRFSKSVEQHIPLEYASTFQSLISYLVAFNNCCNSRYNRNHITIWKVSWHKFVDCYGIFVSQLKSLQLSKRYRNPVLFLWIDMVWELLPNMSVCHTFLVTGSAKIVKIERNASICFNCGINIVVIIQLIQINIVNKQELFPSY